MRGGSCEADGEVSCILRLRIRKTGNESGMKIKLPGESGSCKNSIEHAGFIN